VAKEPEQWKRCVFDPICLNIADDITVELNGDICARISQALDAAHGNGSEGLHTLPGSGILGREAHVWF
jgi:hypothetical protein